MTESTTHLPTADGSEGLRLRAFSPLEDGVASFLAHFEVGGPHRRLAADATRKAYATDLHQFARFVHPRTTAASLGAVDAAIVRAFVSHQLAKGKPSTASRKLAAVRALYRYLGELGLLTADPTAGIKVEGSAPEDVGPGLGVDTIKASLTRSDPNRDSERDFARARDTAVIEVLYGGGLRLNELIDLNLTALHLPEGTVRVTSRNGPRQVPIGSRAVAALKRYLLCRADQLVEVDISRVDAGALFLNSTGKRLHRRSIQRIVERSLRQAPASDTDCGPRALRRAFAAHMLDAGASFQAVAELLGQRTFSPPAENDIDDLRRVYQQAHPRS